MPSQEGLVRRDSHVERVLDVAERALREDVWRVRAATAWATAPPEISARAVASTKPSPIPPPAGLVPTADDATCAAAPTPIAVRPGQIRRSPPAASFAKGRGTRAAAGLAAPRGAPAPRRLALTCSSQDGFSKR